MESTKNINDDARFYEFDENIKLYESNDLVRLNSDGCKNCHKCCQGMGDSIILDPLDVYRLTTNLNKGINELMASNIELNVHDGLILPNIRMSGDDDMCAFLDKNGRCSIHKFRPGLCRMFPLGRYYKDGVMRYFVLSGGCTSCETSKTKIKKWINTDNFKQYEIYIHQWHDFVRSIKDIIEKETDDNNIKNISLYILNNFYINPYLCEDFYDEFFDRLEKAKMELL